MLREFIYVIRPVRPDMHIDGPTNAEQAVIAEHFRYVEALAREGMVLLAGRTQTTDERTFGIVIFRADDEASAIALADADPAVLHRVMRVEVIPFRVAVLSSTWSTE